MILMMGYDQILLRSRALVLRSAGFLVTECNSVHTCMEAILRSPFQALLMCGTVTPRDALQLVPMFRRRNVRARVLQFASTATADLLPGVDCLIQTDDGVASVLDQLKRELEPKFRNIAHAK